MMASSRFRTAIIFGCLLGTCPAMATENATGKDTGTLGKAAVEKSKDSVDAIKTYSIAKKDEALKDAKEALDVFDAKMKELEQRIKEEKTQWGAKMAMEKEVKLEELKKARAAASTHYDELKRASQKAWQAAKANFLSSYHKLEKKFTALKDEGSAVQKPAAKTQ